MAASATISKNPRNTHPPKKMTRATSDPKSDAKKFFMAVQASRFPTLSQRKDEEGGGKLADDGPDGILGMVFPLPVIHECWGEPTTRRHE
jgi:hypothetical protein